jgi:Zn-dependent protease
LFNNLFIQQAFDPATRTYFFAALLSVVISITLHELAHGWAAIRLGDNTPIHTGHMTGNPLVHMGPFSIAALLIVGIAWGQMPIDPTRLRGRYAEALVALAGPATNFLLAFVALTGLGIWLRFGGPIDTQVEENVQILLEAFGGINLLLGVFNLLPVPPLDGSHILANFSRPYAQFISDPAHQGIMMLAFIFTFAVVSVIILPIYVIAHVYVLLLSSL